MSRIRRSTPVIVLLAGCALLGAGVAGVARVDTPLQAAAQQQPVVQQPVDITWHHHGHRGDDCAPRPTERT